MSTKKLTRLSLLTALALIIFIVEAQLPPIAPIPGIKMGLANIITLVALYMYGPKEAFTVLFLRIILGNMFSGQVSALMYSAAGGIFCFAVMCVLYKILPRDMLWVVSVCGAMAHVTAQVTVAALITKTPAVFWYLPLLLVSAVITGAFTGLCAYYVLKRWKK